MRQRKFKICDFIEKGEYFHFARKFIDSKRPSYQHYHDYHEVFLVTAGELDHILQTTTKRLKRGALVFIRADDSHALKSANNEPCEIINVSFPSFIVEHLGKRYYEELNGRFFWHNKLTPDVYQLSAPRLERAINLSKELQLSNRTLLSIEEFLMSLMIRVVEYIAPTKESAPDWLLKAIVAARKPEVFKEGAAGFVKAACRGHEHVCRVTKQYLGISPSEHINKVRMEYAAMLLSSSDYSINQIATECGIDNPSYFYRTFQKQYGSTPKQYRIHNRKNPIEAH